MKKIVFAKQLTMQYLLLLFLIYANYSCKVLREVFPTPAFRTFVNFFNDVSVHKAKHTDLKLIIFIMSEGELQNLNKDQKKIEPCGSCFARLGLMGDK